MPLFTCPELVHRNPEQRGGCHGEWECYVDAHEFGVPLQGGAHIPKSEAGNSFLHCRKQSKNTSIKMTCFIV